jgi:hypothetical protein
LYEYAKQVHGTGKTCDTKAQQNLMECDDAMQRHAMILLPFEQTNASNDSVAEGTILPPEN